VLIADRADDRYALAAVLAAMNFYVNLFLQVEPIRRTQQVPPSATRIPAPPSLRHSIKRKAKYWDSEENSDSYE